MPEFSSIVGNLPFLVPFLAPEALERMLGRPMELRLGANESSFELSAKARAAMEDALGHVGWYGDPEGYDLREALAAHHRVTRENIALGAGLDDLLALSARVFLNPGDRAVNSLGGYPTFNYGVQGTGGLLEFVPYKEDKVDLERIAVVAAEVGAKVVFVANPDNPSGSWHSAEEMKQFLEMLPHECVLLLDEAYSDFAPQKAILPVDVSNERIIRFRTFSKAHGMAGARIGYSIASASITQAFDKIRMHFGVNRIAQIGALASLQDPGHLRSIVEEVARGRAEYASLASRLGLKALPSATNFVAIDMGSYERAKNTMDTLLKRGVFIRMPGAAPLNRCIRVSVGTAPERKRFGEELAAVLDLTVA